MKRTTELDATASTPPAANPGPPPRPERSRLRASAGLDAARYGQDIEDRYVQARDAWTKAMQGASSGRAADMASLAIAQEAYEAVAAERERWLSSGRIAIPIQPSPKRNDIEVAVGQELAWRRVQQHERRGGLFSRIRRRLSGH